MTSKNSQSATVKNATKKPQSLDPIGTPSASPYWYQTLRLKTDPGTLEYTDTEKIAVDWDRLEEGEDFQLVSPTAFFSFQLIFKSSSIASSIHPASRSREATSVERCERGWDLESNDKSGALAERSRPFLWCSVACCLTNYLAQHPIACSILAWVACGMFS